MRKIFKRLMACALALCMLTGIMPVGQISSEVYAAAPTAIQPQWEEVQSIVSQYNGEWNNTNYAGAITNKLPKTALLGNGDVGITSYGNNKEKTFLVSKGDFWTYNYSPILVGGVTIGAQPEETDGPKNLALDATVTASSTSISEPISAAVDGIKDNFWASGVGATQWLQLEFAEPVTIGRYVVYNYENVVGWSACNTADWTLEISNNGTDWSAVDTVTDNTLATYDTNLDNQVRAKYVRLYATQTQTPADCDPNPRLRIAEFELYAEAKEENVNLALDATVTASSTSGSEPISAAVDGIIGQGNFWASGLGATQWLQLEYAEPVTIGRYVIYNYEHATGSTYYNTVDWKLEISDDGNTWETVSAVTGNTSATRSINLAEKVTTKYIRLHATKTHPDKTTDPNPRLRIAEFELYAEPKDVNYAWNKTVETCCIDGGSADAIINLARREGTVVSASSEGLPDGPAAAAIDGNPKTFWHSKEGSLDNNQQLTLEFAEEATIKKYVLYNYQNREGWENNNLCNTVAWEVLVSTDGNAWEEVDKVTGNSDAIVERTLENSVKAKYVRIHITDPSVNHEGWTGLRARINEFEVYGSFNDTSSANNASKLVDGKTETQWTSKNVTTKNADEHWAIFDLKSEQTINWYQLAHEAGHVTKGWKLQYLPSGTTLDWNTIEESDAWVDMASEDNNTELTNSGTLTTAVTARYVRLLVTDPCADCTTVRICELELKGTAPQEPAVEYDVDSIDVCCVNEADSTVSGNNLIDNNTSTQWSSKTYCGVEDRNLALEAQKVVATDASGSNPKENINDADLTNFWQSGNANGTKSIQLTFEEKARISAYKLYQYSHGLGDGNEVNYDYDAKAWECWLHDGNGNWWEDNEYTVAEDSRDSIIAINLDTPEIVKDVTISITELVRNVTGNVGSDPARIRELEVYGHYLSEENSDHVATFDLGEAKKVGYYEVYHAGNGQNTKEFELQYKDAEGNWVAADSVSDNDADVTKKSITSITAQYWRILIEDPGSTDNTAHIQEIKFMDKAPVADASNYASGADVKVCGALENCAGANMVDGKADTKWSADHIEKEHHYAVVDLGKDTQIGYYEVYHAGNGQNTKEFELQYKDGENWVTADAVSGNTENVTKKTLATAKTARYWRLFITDPGNADDTARIQELVLMKAEPEPELEAELSKPVNFHEKQDILNAEIQTEQTLAETETEMKTWLSADKNIMVTELTSKAAAGSEPAKMRVMTYTPVSSDKPITVAKDDTSVTVTRCTANTGKNAANGHVSQVAISTKIIGADAVKTSVAERRGQGYLDFTLAAGDKIYIVTAIGGGGRTYKNDGTTLWDNTVVVPAEEAKTLLRSVTDEIDVTKLNTERQEWWKDFWLTSYVKLDTSSDDRLKAIQKYYYAAQYYMGSTSKAGEVAPGLYGVWHTTDNASWDSDYHMNYNFISTFYGTYSSNRPELALNGAQALLDYMPEGERRASSVSELKEVEPKYFIQSRIDAGAIDPVNGIKDALLFPVGIGPWGMTCDDGYWGEFMLAAFNSCLITWYYEYTLDKEFLKNGGYDFLKKAVALYEAIIVKEDSTENKDGYEYVIYASQREGSVASNTWAKNPAIEVFSLKYTLSHLIEYSELLGRDADKRDKWKEIYEHLPAQPTMQKDGKTVLAMSDKLYKNGEWIDTPWEAAFIAADALYPAQVYTYFSSPEDLEIFQNTYDTWQGWLGGSNSFGRDFTLGVQMRYDVDKVITEFAKVINGQMAPNLAINDNTHGVEKIGATETVNSMMLISADGINKVFPNWLEDTDAKFVNLRAKGAFTVSAEYDGTAKEAKEGITITSEAGQDMTLVVPWAVGAIVKDSAGNIVSTEKGTVPNWEDEKTITFKTTKGETYTVWKPEHPEIVEVTNPADIIVENGTAISAVELPETVKVTLFDDTELDAKVTWNTDSYDGSKAGTYALTGTLGESDKYVNYDGLTAAVNVIVKEAAKNEGVDTKIEIHEGITAVPEAFKNNNRLNTVEKIEKAMKTVITEKANIPEKNIAVYDVVFMYSDDDGQTWVKADSTHFPANGKLKVQLPYPKGTGKDTHNFVVAHMFTTADFGKTPGDVEYPTVTKTANGLEFEVTGLSPISVGWTEISKEDTSTDNGGAGNSQSTDKTDTSKPVEVHKAPTKETSKAATPTNTGDAAMPIVFVILAAAAAGALIMLKKQKVNKTK